MELLPLYTRHDLDKDVIAPSTLADGLEVVLHSPNQFVRGTKTVCVFAPEVSMVILACRFDPTRISMVFSFGNMRWVRQDINVDLIQRGTSGKVFRLTSVSVTTSRCLCLITKALTCLHCAPDRTRERSARCNVASGDSMSLRRTSSGTARRAASGTTSNVFRGERPSRIFARIPALAPPIGLLGTPRPTVVFPCSWC